MWSSWCMDCTRWGRIVFPGSTHTAAGQAQHNGVDSVDNDSAWAEGELQKQRIHRSVSFPASRAAVEKEDGGAWMLMGSNSSLVRSSGLIRNYSQDLQPFKEISRNKITRQSIKSLGINSSSSDEGRSTNVSSNRSSTNSSRRDSSRRDSRSMESRSRTSRKSRDSSWSLRSRSSLVSSSSKSGGRHKARQDVPNEVDFDVSWGNEEEADKQQFVMKQNSRGRWEMTPLPTPATVTIRQQPRSADIYRPDMDDQMDSSSSSSRPLSESYGTRTAQQLQQMRSSHAPVRSISVYQAPTQSDITVRTKKHSISYLTPEEAARLPQTHDSTRWSASNAPSGRDGALTSPGDPKSSSIKERLRKTSLLWDVQNSQPQQEQAGAEPKDGSGARNGVIEKNWFSQQISRMVGGSEAGKTKFEYVSPNSKSGAKVQLRSKTTVDSIVNRKPFQSQALMHYTFGAITIAYKVSMEKKLHIDVLSVTNLPKYSSAQDGEKNPSQSKVPTLNYVDIEVCLKLSKGRAMTHKIKKFRTGHVQTDDDDSFEPECTFKSKALERSEVVLSVYRRDRGGLSPHRSVGHGLFTITRKDVETPGILKKKIDLKQGAEKQEVKGSVQLVLTCSQRTAAGDVKLTLDVKLVQHMDVEKLGIRPNSPDFSTAPEIKIKTQLLGSTKAGSSKVQEFPWIALTNKNRRGDQEGESNDPRLSSLDQRSLGGWNTRFPDGCKTDRTALDDELRDFSLCFVVQVWGRNNVLPASKKEVLLGTVVLGPELKSAYSPAIDLYDGEDCTVTHWGQAINKRAAVEMTHRLHL